MTPNKREQWDFTDDEMEEYYRQEKEDQAQQDYIWEMRNAEEN